MDDAAQAQTLILSGLFTAIVLGGLAGWLAGKLVTGGGFGLAGNVILGIGGALLADWLLPRIGISLGSGLFGSLLAAVIGGAIVLIAIRVVKRI